MRKSAVFRLSSTKGRGLERGVRMKSPARPLLARRKQCLVPMVATTSSATPEGRKSTSTKRKASGDNTIDTPTKRAKRAGPSKLSAEDDEPAASKASTQEEGIVPSLSWLWLLRQGR
ncbi:hypothetical protein PG985_008539 [Apiospora marii]|uniref:uncharacterized protein n=1 Tax=Apiospora marii TaxID=335849 RepID=UPI00312FC203